MLAERFGAPQTVIASDAGAKQSISHRGSPRSDESELAMTLSGAMRDWIGLLQAHGAMDSRFRGKDTQRYCDPAVACVCAVAYNPPFAVDHFGRSSLVMTLALPSLRSRRSGRSRRCAVAYNPHRILLQPFHPRDDGNREKRDLPGPPGWTMVYGIKLKRKNERA